MRASVWAALAIFALAQERPRPNILLVTIDTLRADRVGRTALTPALDGLAARGARFTRAYAHAPTTLASHASILTGLLPASHGVRNNGTFRLAADHTTLAERLRAAGYRTGAFVAAFVLDSRYGLDQGFDHYDDRYQPVQPATPPPAIRFAERRAADVLAAAAAWIARERKPWFAWVHLFDPHAPWDAPGRLAPHPYDNEVAYVDASLHAFLEPMRSSGAIARTLVMVTADHGESLGEHGERTHGLFAYGSTISVPLLLAGPGVEARTVIAPAAHVDIAPTLLELAGLSVPATDGRSLTPWLRGQRLPERPVYFEALDAALTRGWAPLTGVIVDGWKFIDLPLPELYDLSADADEKVNRVAQDPARAARLRELTARFRSAPSPPTPVALADADARARLRSLGYVGAAAASGGSWRTEDDPKRRLPLHNRFLDAMEVASVRPDAAVRDLRTIIDANPGFAAAYDVAAALLIEQGRARDAASLLRTAQARGLKHAALSERLGAALTASGEAREAIAVLEPVVQAEPDAVDPHYALALAHAAAGEHTKAREHFAAVVRIDPTAHAGWTNLGTLDLQRGAMREAQRAFEQALLFDPDSVPAMKGLGAALERSNPAAAAAAWERALSRAPNDYATLARLAFLLADTAPDRARPHLERLARDAPAAFAAEKRRARELLQKLR